MTETVCLVQTSTSAMGSICYLWSGVISSEVISSNVILSKVILSKVILANGWLMGPCEDLSHEVLLWVQLGQSAWYRLLQVLWVKYLWSHVISSEVISSDVISSDVILSKVILANGWLMGPCEDLSHLSPTLSTTETVCIVQTSTSAMGSIWWYHRSYRPRSYRPMSYCPKSYCPRSY